MQTKRLDNAIDYVLAGGRWRAAWVVFVLTAIVNAIAAQALFIPFLLLGLVSSTHSLLVLSISLAWGAICALYVWVMYGYNYDEENDDA
jgi:hypothetical protein